LITGGHGRLGNELRRILPAMIAPDLPAFDITHPENVARALDEVQPCCVVHAAAYTDVAGAERERAACWRVNVAGTRHVAQAVAARGIFLVHISTDYVFDGTRGNYREDDTPGPPCNYYALTKLVAEEAVRMTPAHLIIRTSFRPREWPYATAFTDVFSSQDYVDIIAPEIALAIAHAGEMPFDTLHIATERKSVYALAARRKPDVRAASKHDVGVKLPNDISLDCTRWQQWKTAWEARS